ncbi:YceI family protein [Microbispora bryophytorum]|uniref:YceI family protein n=1 Tax=Microbispora bryophytorum TaxID=1460882 RepID=UPI0034033EB0
MTTTETLAAPGLTAGVWTIDTAHSEVSFSVRHMMIAAVRGSFGAVGGTIEVAPELTASSIEVEVDTASVYTRNPKRDEHIRSATFLDVEKYPAATFRSTRLEPAGSSTAVLTGELTMHGTTREVRFDLRFNGVRVDPWGSTKAGFSAETVIDRHDFGMVTDMPLDTGELFVGREVTLTIELEAAAQ